MKKTDHVDTETIHYYMDRSAALFPAGAQGCPWCSCWCRFFGLDSKVEGMYKSGALPDSVLPGLAEIPLHNKFSLRTELGFVNQGINFIRINHW